MKINGCSFTDEINLPMTFDRGGFTSVISLSLHSVGVSHVLHTSSWVLCVCVSIGQFESCVYVSYVGTILGPRDGPRFQRE